MRSLPVGSGVILCLAGDGGKRDMSSREQGRTSREQAGNEARSRRERGADKPRARPGRPGYAGFQGGGNLGFRGRSREDGAGGFIFGNCAGKGRESLTVAR